MKILQKEGNLFKFRKSIFYVLEGGFDMYIYANGQWITLSILSCRLIGDDILYNHDLMNFYFSLPKDNLLLS
jgi:hypothetical protein